MSMNRNSSSSGIPMVGKDCRNRGITILMGTISTSSIIRTPASSMNRSIMMNLATAKGRNSSNLECRMTNEAF
jgi:hypothetical protein